MKIFGWELRKASKKEIANVESLNSYESLYTSRSYALLQSTTYRCVEILSNSVAELELRTFKKDEQGYYERLINSNLYYLLSRQPNQYMSAYTLKKIMVISMLLKGNAYAYIERDLKGEAIGIYYLPAETVKIVYVKINNIKRKMYSVNGFKKYVDPKDIIHVMNITFDGQKGISTLHYAQNTIDIANANDMHVKSYFQNGANVSGILSVEGVRLTKPQKDSIYKNWANRMNPTTGSKVPIVILEQNQKYQPISLSPKDSQMLESREFNVIDICRFFGVSPVKCFDLSKSSYSTVEASQIDFLNDSLAPLLTKIEEEFNRKIIPRIKWNVLEIKFDLTNLLRADKNSQAKFYSTMFQIGAITPNEIRMNLNMDKVPNGDQTFVQVNVQTLQQVMNNIIQQQNNNDDGKK